MEQLTLLPEIDEKATKQAVERVLEKYRIYKLQVSLDRLPTITADYSFMPRSYTGKPSDSTAESAIKNAEYSTEREAHIKLVELGMQHLEEIEQKIISGCYLNQSIKLDYQIYSENNLSERTYYRRKKEAIIKLAWIWNLVYYLE